MASMSSRSDQSLVKSLSHVRLFATPWTVACTRLLRPWDFLGKSTGVGCHFLLQGIFPTQGLNPGLPHYRQTLYWNAFKSQKMDIYVDKHCWQRFNGAEVIQMSLRTWIGVLVCSSHHNKAPYILGSLNNRNLFLTNPEARSRCWLI